jgi:hypothetical protein
MADRNVFIARVKAFGDRYFAANGREETSLAVELALLGAIAGVGVTSQWMDPRSRQLVACAGSWLLRLAEGREASLATLYRELSAIEAGEELH